ncbi:periplasmic heavy metal sensor [Pedomonas mirosovicensis]|uniref:periplasmic heavy metal sensor n=1 Tax=Pedomonas mirosovicensis TaxID=2908641 RepID=UPI002167156C|nr:periplasmic heavy metal sensor [Pedomonas mirosovicensis]MCH8684587.1 periplasmic heavy metal sensor [Pedomonas mirosovicensis]
MAPEDLASGRRCRPGSFGRGKPGARACIAAASATSRQGTWAGGPRPPRFHEVIARMSPEGREIMAEAVRKGAPEKRNWEALKETREEILRLIAAPNLDTEALEGAFVRERKLSLKLQAGRHEALLKAAGRLSPEDRQIFAEGLRATRLHIPGETIKQIQKAKDRCRNEKGQNEKGGDRKAR